MAGCGDAKKVCLSDIPTEILFHICSELDFRSLVRLGQTCKTLLDVCSEDSMWKQQCMIEYLVSEKDADQESWFEQFRWYHHRFGHRHCPSVYRVMRRLWDRMETYLSNNDPELLETLRDPCDISEIQIAEEKMECPFPADLRCSLQIHNGQQMTNGRGLLGCMSIASYYRSEGLLDAASMARCYEPRWGDVPGCIPITYCFQSRKCQYIGVDERAGYKVGEVFYPINASEQYAENVDIFISGSSYREWFEDLVVKLESNAFPRIGKSIYRFEHEPDCVTTTRGCFTVKASTCFLPEVSTVNPAHFLHVYRITMSMDEDADVSLSCQLETRHWIITDMDGAEERVDGEGVVGEFPIMEPGATYSWISCTTFATTYGNMRGSFTMRSLQSGEEIEIECPTFQMRCLPYKLSSERKQAMLRRKKNL